MSQKFVKGLSKLCKNTTGEEKLQLDINDVIESLKIIASRFILNTNELNNQQNSSESNLLIRTNEQATSPSIISPNTGFEEFSNHFFTCIKIVKCLSRVKESNYKRFTPRMCFLEIIKKNLVARRLLQVINLFYFIL